MHLQHQTSGICFIQSVHQAVYSTLSNTRLLSWQLTIPSYKSLSQTTKTQRAALYSKCFLLCHSHSLVRSAARDVYLTARLRFCPLTTHWVRKQFILQQSAYLQRPQLSAPASLRNFPPQLWIFCTLKLIGSLNAPLSSNSVNSC